MLPLSLPAALRRPCSSRRAAALVILALVAATATVTTSSLLRPGEPPVAAPRAADVLARLPVSFEPAGDARFVSRGPGYSLSLTPAEATVDVGGAVFGLRPAGPLADPAATMVGTEPLSGTVTRLTGDDPAGWQTGLPTFARVEARQVWPGVDMVWHGSQRRLEHDMVVAPGVDPALVTFEVAGARSVRLEPGGDLVLDLGTTSARLARPVVYQDVSGQRREVPAGFTLLAPTRIGFRVGAYDPALPLVIDPTLVTSTFLGGIGNDSGYAIAVDAQGNTYVAGSTESADFTTNAPLQTALNGAGTSDAFVSKLSPDGSRLVWSTYLGGSGRDTGFAVAVATDGSVYVGGVTESANFPNARAAQTAYGGGPSDAFVARIAANGTGLEWSTFVGGSQTDRGRGLAIDAAGNAYLTGSTSSADFPAVNAQQPGPFRADDLDAFLVKLPSSGTPVTFATRLGGGSDDRGLAVAVDTQGNAYVTGDTLSTGFPTVRPLQAASGLSAGSSLPDAFLAKYNPAGSALVYSTFLGGSDFDQGTGIAVDGQGAAYVTGNTNSSNFPTVGALQSAKGNEPDAFVTKVDPPGGALVFSTYLGGSGADGANGIAVDRTGSAHVVGTTGSANWPMAKATQATKGGADDAFVLKLDSTGRGPLFSTFLGGNESEAAMGVTIGLQGAVHVLGLTGSSNFPSVKPVQGSRPAAGGDAFVASFDPIDVAAPDTAAAAPAAAPSSSSSSGSHDRRVRLLAALTFVLLVAAGLQTLFLRRRSPAMTGGRPRPRLVPATPAGRAVTEPETATGGAGAKKAAASTKASPGPRSTRSPKARGGPKAAAAKKAGAAAKSTGPQKGGPAPAADDKTGAEAFSAAAGDAGAGAGDLTDAPDVAGVEVDIDVAGPPTVTTPAPRPPRVKPQEPAIAHLLDEDLWAAEPPRPSDAALASEGGAPPEAPDAPIDWAPFDTGSTPAVGDAPPAQEPPAAALPPVPAEELSFWDLFPEDLPPARTTSFPVEELLAPDHLALPEGPESAVSRLVGAGDDDPPEAPPEGSPAPAPRPPHPPEAEFVIAELLDGPLPTGLRPSAESAWAPQAPADDFLVDDLLAVRPETTGTRPDATGTQPDGGEDGDEAEGDDPDADGDDGELTGASNGRSPEEQARIAADRARRRRSRRGGRGRRPPGAG